MTNTAQTDRVHKGGCHCGRVRFEFRAPAALPMTLCNCSICARTAYQHIFVPREDFTLLGIMDDLTEYRFNTGAAQHLFCRVCGVKSFYGPRSHPAAWSVNYRCVNPGTLSISETIEFDGQDWEDSIATLRDRT